MFYTRVRIVSKSKHLGMFLELISFEVGNKTTMALPSIFDNTVTEKIIERIHQLHPNLSPLWGKMNVSQMLAHCNVAYEMTYEKIHPEPNVLLRFVLKTLVKNKIVTEAAYGRNLHTAPQFIIKDDRNFDIEKERLIAFIRKTQQLGTTYFEGRRSHSFGALKSIEWNNMFYKHLEHHLSQFGV